jgi:hypothetical protein
VILTAKDGRMKENAKPRLTLTPYLALSRNLSALITPVRPRDEFRASLYRSLVAQAGPAGLGVDGEQRLSADAAMLAVRDGRTTHTIPARFAHWVATTPGQDRRWVWGAAAVGSAVSLAGLVTYMWRRRSSRAA